MLRKIIYYLCMSIGVLTIVTSIVVHFVLGGEIQNTFTIALSGLIPIFIALSNKVPKDTSKKN